MRAKIIADIAGIGVLVVLLFAWLKGFDQITVTSNNNPQWHMGVWWLVTYVGAWFLTAWLIFAYIRWIHKKD